VNQKDAENESIYGSLSPRDDRVHGLSKAVRTSDKFANLAGPNHDSAGFSSVGACAEAG
jgi:hypothetical protein